MLRLHKRESKTNVKVNDFINWQLVKQNGKKTMYTVRRTGKNTIKTR